ncbi:hypothetical protein JX265_004873 [Neoarthrinium moseri]|uniref:GH18 domain-containing protein n=1 Tax=Neoarthrinium moseri TaxID=1658444 RepID=A0A9P9WQ72_9PEZI|nr:uncharacterized protein JN550_003624 [Neoarthrinium moseri]KAI1846903.1 hypothetical protein JX266_007124 [Neoarthrinium moseri]KAI1872750.1 hypothetical protein JN550_003624 [Neoarthrinium moseri]KAI1874665.1 hypothetical protein JX265_004873 [Neoarthrinium moseri]
MARLTLISVIGLLASVPWAHARFDSTLQTNLAVYWGQNSYGTVNSQQRLSAYCSMTQINIIPIAYMNGINTPSINLTTSNNNCSAYTGSQLLDCAQLENDIKICQKTYGKTVMLTLGGTTFNEVGFESVAKAEEAAVRVWQLFGPAIATENRPFRTAVIDGFNFDFKSSATNIVAFAAKLRAITDNNFSLPWLSGGSNAQKKTYLAASPSCSFPNPSMNDILANVYLDMVFVQFYDSSCGANTFLSNFASSSQPQIQPNFNLRTWNTWATSLSVNKDVKIFVGLPAGVAAANSGYVYGDQLCAIITFAKTFSNFGGVVLWDMTSQISHINDLDLVNSKRLEYWNSRGIVDFASIDFIRDYFVPAEHHSHPVFARYLSFFFV